MATALAHIIPSKAYESNSLVMTPFPSTAFAIETRLISPSASFFVLNRVPPRVHADQALELELADIGLCAGPGMAESIASWISAHALLQISIQGRPQEKASVLVKARPSEGAWIVRALVRPASWTDAASVTVVSLSLAGRPVPCDSLPATLRVGYNHAPAPAGAVYAAAKVGDLPALLEAIEAGGSTEEADTVRGRGWGVTRREFGMSQSLQYHSIFPPLLPCATFCCRAAGLGFSALLPEATSRLFACSYQQAPTRPQQTR